MALRTTDSILAVCRRWTEVALSDHPWGDSSNPDPPPETPAIERNSIIDAEQLECILLPQFTLSRFDLSEYGKANYEKFAEVLNQLAPLSEREREIDPKALDEIEGRISDFLDRNAQDGQPSFGHGNYLGIAGGKAPAVAPHEMPAVVDAYTLSLSVCLQAMHLIDRWLGHPDVTRQGALQRKLIETRGKCERRLTAAMLGLSRSFTSSALPDYEQNIMRPFPDTQSMREIRRRLRPADRPKSAFECGWSWGATPPGDDGGERELYYREIEQEAHLSALAGPHDAQAAPYLYFTVTAMEGIADFSIPRVRGSDLLNPAQAFLQTRLRAYAEMTAQYWGELVFEDLGGRWAIEDLPWVTADKSASDYWSLYLLLIATSSEEVTGRFAEEDKIERLLLVLEELAQRARLTRDPHPRDSDPALRLLHAPPGYRLELGLADRDDPSDARESGYEWWIYDFGPKMLKLTARLLGLSRDRRLRERARELVDAIWEDHLKLRRFDSTPASFAWDDVQGAFEQLPGPPRVDGYLVGSWYITERVVEGLVAVAEAERQRTFTPVATREMAREMLEELRWMETGAEVDIDDATLALLDRAERLIEASYPSAAVGLLNKAAETIADSVALRE